jgi:hypothetical protein
MQDPSARSDSRLRITKLIRPHLKVLALGLLAAAGEGLANLLEP